MTVRLLLILGRSVGFAGAALTAVLMAWWGQDLFRYAFFSEDPTWDEVGVIPFVDAFGSSSRRGPRGASSGSTEAPC